jgi:hypothetical protein
MIVSNKQFGVRQSTRKLFIEIWMFVARPNIIRSSFFIFTISPYSPFSLFLLQPQFRV